MRSRAWRAGDDDARRHQHGDARRRRTGDAGRHGAGLAMTRATVVQRIVGIGILPVARAASGAEAMAGADAVGDGGIRALEITTTVPGASRRIGEPGAR